MSEYDEELVERVAGAIKAAWPGEERMSRAVLDELAPELRHDPPEGCEWVALPTEVVDRYGNRDYEGPIAHACRDAQARRPKPEPRTERVPAIEALGREVVSDEGSDHPTFIGSSIVRWVYDGLAVQSYSGRSQQRVAPDGTVEVLAEDGAE